MDIQHIPRTFWHALSIAVIVVSSGLTYIAYRSSNVSIELANAKINLSSEVASSTIALNAALDEAKKAKTEAESKYTKLLEKHEALKEQLASIEEKAKTDSALKMSLEKIKDNCPDCTRLNPITERLEFNTFDTNIIKAEKSLSRLEAINKQIQPIQ
ncbi:MAG: hypothetical protein JAY74_05640 [Candidatus Thiodiazotropha taylori]|nr:hypothetical protein [Candidatus Thiodiazotropha taylori]